MSRLSIHELATNVAKYGALSATIGTIKAKWQIEEGFCGPRLALEWREAGGPPVSPPQRKGFGTTLITRSLAQTKGSEVTLEYPSEGLVCRMNIPLKK